MRSREQRANQTSPQHRTLGTLRLAPELPQKHQGYTWLEATVQSEVLGSR